MQNHKGAFHNIAKVSSRGIHGHVLRETSCREELTKVGRRDPPKSGKWNTPLHQSRVDSWLLPSGCVSSSCSCLKKRRVFFPGNGSGSNLEDPVLGVDVLQQAAQGLSAGVADHLTPGLPKPPMSPDLSRTLPISRGWGCSPPEVV